MWQNKLFKNDGPTLANLIDAAVARERVGQSNKNLGINVAKCLQLVKQQKQYVNKQAGLKDTPCVINETTNLLRFLIRSNLIVLYVDKQRQT